MKLPWYRKLAFACGHFMNVVAISMWFPYSVIFYQKVIGLPPSDVGNIILIAQIAGAISLPFIGMWSDQTVLKYGRRKIFHLFGTLATGSVLFFMWHDCLGCTAAPPLYQVIYFASFAVVFQFGWAATQIAQLSLIPELVRNKSAQVGINAMRTTFTIVANIVIFVCFLVLLTVFNNKSGSGGGSTGVTPEDKDVFWIVAIIAIALGFLFGAPFQFLIYEKPNAAQLPRLRWYQWLKKPQFLLAICGFVTARIIFVVPQTYLPLYLTDTLQMMKSSVAIGPLVLYVTAFITTFIVKLVSSKIGNLMMFFLGMAVVWGALIWFWVKDPTSVSPGTTFSVARDNVYVAIVLLGIGGATVLVLSYTMISQLVGRYTGSSAFVYGWVAFFDRLSNGITVRIIQEFAPNSLTNYASQQFYRHVLVFPPFAASALGLVTLSAYLLLQRFQKEDIRLTDQEISQTMSIQVSRRITNQARVGR